MNSRKPKLTPVDALSYCSSVLTVKRTLDLLGYSISKSHIRKELSVYDTFPNLSLEDLSNYFDSLSVKCQAFKISCETFEEDYLFYPAIAALSYGENKLNTEFCTIYQAGMGNIQYYSPSCGDISESLQSFNEKWSSVLLLLEIDETSLEKNIEVVDKVEEEEIDKYKENIKVYDDIFKEDVCEYIVKYCEKNSLFSRSKVVNDSEYIKDVSEVRTSFTSFIKDRDDIIFKFIYEKVADLLDLPQSYIEDLQCVRYTKGQEFKVHFDTLYTSDLNSRFHTLLLYLNDDFSGGETFFPEVDMKIRPKTGRLLHFINKKQTGERILYSAHAGLPVENGVKYACNIWVKGDVEETASI